MAEWELVGDGCEGTNRGFARLAQKGASSYNLSKEFIICLCKRCVRKKKVGLVPVSASRILERYRPRGEIEKFRELGYFGRSAQRTSAALKGSIFDLGEFLQIKFENLRSFTCEAAFLCARNSRKTRKEYF